MHLHVDLPFLVFIISILRIQKIRLARSNHNNNVMPILTTGYNLVSLTYSIVVIFSEKGHHRSQRCSRNSSLWNTKLLIVCRTLHHCLAITAKAPKMIIYIYVIYIEVRQTGGGLSRLLFSACCC